MTKEQLQIIELLSVVASELKEVHTREELLLEEQKKLTDELFKTIDKPKVIKKKDK